MKKLAVLLSCAFASLAASGANLADFPRLDGETSDSPRLARAVASVPLGVLDIPENLVLRRGKLGATFPKAGTRLTPP